MTMLIFVYGTLKQGYENHEPFIGGSKLIGYGRTKYRYIMAGLSYPKIASSKKGKVVTGELYEVPLKRLPRLDQLESGYTRVRGQIELEDGQTVWASYYIIRHPLPWMRPNKQWDAGDAYTWTS